jgi:virulence-associated protein VapD
LKITVIEIFIFIKKRKFNNLQSVVQLPQQFDESDNFFPLQISFRCFSQFLKSFNDLKVYQIISFLRVSEAFPGYISVEEKRVMVVRGGGGAGGGGE